MRLNALLITPVQRIPRYKMLLEDVIKNTPDCHPDKKSLKEALEQIDALAWHINDQVGTDGGTTSCPLEIIILLEYLD